MTSNKLKNLDNINKEESIFFKKTFEFIDGYKFSRSYSESLPNGPKIELINFNGNIEYSGYINSELIHFLAQISYNLIFNEFKVFENLQILIDYIFNDYNESLTNIINKSEYIKAQIIYNNKEIKIMSLDMILRSWYKINDYEPVIVNFKYSMQKEYCFYVHKNIIPKNYVKKYENFRNSWYGIKYAFYKS